MHQATLDMPGELTAQAQAFKPCGVTFKSSVQTKVKTEVKALTYDSKGRLVNVKATTLSRSGEQKTVNLIAEYDDQGNTTRLQYRETSYLAYEYDDGVLARIKVMVKEGEGFNVVSQQKVMTSSSGETVVFEEVLKDGETKEPAVMAYTFDSTGRVLFKTAMLQKTRSQWRYYPVDTATDTQRVDFHQVEGGKLMDTYTLKGGRLVRIVSAAQDAPDQEYVPYKTRTYTYEGDKLVSAKTVDDKTGETVEAVTYAYTCP